MEKFWVEGIYIPAQGRKKTGKTAAVEPFARCYLASSAQEALRMATEDLQGGQWKEKPRVSKTSEEQRMRSGGQPELPLFAKPRRTR